MILSSIKSLLLRRQMLYNFAKLLAVYPLLKTVIINLKEQNIFVFMIYRKKKNEYKNVCVHDVTGIIS